MVRQRDGCCRLIGYDPTVAVDIEVSIAAYASGLAGGLTHSPAIVSLDASKSAGRQGSGEGTRVTVRASD